MNQIKIKNILSSDVGGALHRNRIHPRSLKWPSASTSRQAAMAITMTSVQLDAGASRQCADIRSIFAISELV